MTPPTRIELMTWSMPPTTLPAVATMAWTSSARGTEPVKITVLLPPGMGTTLAEGTAC